jgi:hypothetical protein
MKNNTQMNKRIGILYLFSILMVNAIFAQELTKNGTPKNKRFGYSIAYFSFRGQSPGFQLGIENYLATTKNYKCFSNANFQYYKEKDLQTGVAFNVGWGQRITTKTGFYIENILRLGLQHTTYIQKIVEFNNGLTTTRYTEKNKNGFSPGIVLGIGYDFSKQTNLPAQIFFRPSFYWLYPDNNLLFQSFFVYEFGIIIVPFRKMKDK